MWRFGSQLKPFLSFDNKEYFLLNPQLVKEVLLLLCTRHLRYPEVIGLHLELFCEGAGPWDIVSLKRFKEYRVCF